MFDVMINSYMNENPDTMTYETPVATENDLGPNTILVTCNHGWSRSKELAFTIRKILSEKGSNKKARLLQDGWTGVVNTIHRLDEKNTPANIFFSHLENGGYLFVASHQAYGFFKDILKAKGKSHLIDQLIDINPYADKEELSEELSKINFL